MTFYRERLLPGPWIFLMWALLIPATLLVFLPINTTVGVIAAVVLYTAAVIVLLATSPMVVVTSTELIAGRARLPLDAVGAVTGYRGKDATIQRGPALDARAWLVIRGWIDPIVKIAVEDENDPAPYWIVSTRNPAGIAEAVAEARAVRGA
jgi:hypothetical protein